MGRTTTTRRRVTLLATIALLGGGLAACGGGGEEAGADGEGGTLDVFVGVNAQYPEEQKAWFEATSAAFEKQTGATIRWETFASASDELTKIQTSVISGDGPDVYGIGTTFTPTAYSTGAFVTLGDEEWEKVGGRDKFVPSSLGISGPSEDEQIGVPWVSRPFVMAYNTELLAAAGIDAPATTWDELTEHAKELTKPGQWGMAIGYKDNFDPWKFVWGMAIQAGNPIVDGKTARVDDPAVRTAYETYFNWLAKDKVVDPASVGWSNAQALGAFSEGKTGYYMLTSALARQALDASPVKGKYAFATLPTVPPGETARPAGGEEAASILSGDNLVVADYSDQKDLAFEFVKMVTDTQGQKDFYDTFGQFPVNAEAAQSLAADPALAPVLEALDKSVATPFTGGWADIQLALTNAVVQSLPDLTRGPLSDAQLDERIDAAQKAAQTALDRSK